MPALSLSGAMGMLLAITVVVAVCSEYLTGAIEAVSESSGLNQVCGMRPRECHWEKWSCQGAVDADCAC